MHNHVGHEAWHAPKRLHHRDNGSYLDESPSFANESNEAASGTSVYRGCLATIYRNYVRTNYSGVWSL
jgi:hypothetical protein